MLFKVKKLIALSIIVTEYIHNASNGMINQITLVAASAG